RTGPGVAYDGLPKFNLEQFDTSYFQRLHDRVRAAAHMGIYVSIMLFESWGLRRVSDAWKMHPFHPANNIQQLSLNPNLQGPEIQTLAFPRVTAIQETYVRKVIDTVNDMDNVLFEITNEGDLSTTDWQYHMIRTIKQYEADKPKQHPVGMTTIGFDVDDSERLYRSSAEWISPSHSERFTYRVDPPANTGKKIILLDTDHLWGIGGNVAWVWKSFLRGHQPLYMDPYEGQIHPLPSQEECEAMRRALGETRRWAEKVNLAAMTPCDELASTGYCLADPGREYLIFQPGHGDFGVDLVAGTYRCEWYSPSSGTVKKGMVKARGGDQAFTPPVSGEIVLYLKATPYR
ncbi:MAG TPA: DUF6298 domain-containing protein, partial [Chthonomonadales bacterium]|nr:DUF6298 domain-containing protein [Chthonomonadales bacterium]